MSKLFDSNEQFQEWFSKDIEEHSQDQKSLNQHKLQKLHSNLKPFMLRRVKKDVKHEIEKKKEFQHHIEMTQRQKELYQTIKEKPSDRKSTPLLHFIMPKLFDSHEHFQEWFSKDIEAHSQDQKSLNQHQLQKLHSILKPFMLRRVKKDVEHEIVQKKEF